VGRKSNSVTEIALLAIWSVTCGLVQAQPQGQGGHGAGQIRGKPQFKSTRDRWFSMSPEDRQVFRRNAERWMQMGPEERNLMRQREKLHQERLKRETEAAIREAGLRLNQEKRELFEQRYLQERRKIERDLRQEEEAKRQKELPVLNDRLKKEFQEPSPATSTTTPAVSATPKR
jgi:hypothetical protein